MKTMKFFAVAVFFFLSAALSASAQTNFWWTNTANNMWSYAADWTNVNGTSTAPATNGNNAYCLIFYAQSAAYSATNDLTNTTYTSFALNNLTFANSATGTNTINLYGGDLMFTNNGAVRPTVSNYTGAASVNIYNNLILANNLAFNLSNSMVVYGLISGGGALTLNTGGGLTLSGGNTYTGGTTNSGNGFLRLGGDNVFGTGSVVLNGNNSGLSASGGARTFTNALFINTNVAFGETANLNNLTNSGVVNLGGAMRSLTVAGSNNTNVTLVLNGSVQNGGLTKMGQGILVLGGSNTYSNGTLISAGLLQFNSSSAIGGAGKNVTNNAAVAFNYAITSNDLNRLSSASTGSLALTVSNLNSAINFYAAGLTNMFLGVMGSNNMVAGNNGNLALTYNLNNYTPFVNSNVNGYNLWKLGGGGGQLIITNNIGGNDSIWIGGNSGAIAVTMNPYQFPYVQLAGNNSYAGATVITNGMILFVTNSANLGNTSLINISSGGGTLLLSNVNVTAPIVVNGASAPGGYPNPNSAQISIAGNSSNIISGAITNNGYALNIKADVYPANGGSGSYGQTIISGGIINSSNNNVYLYDDTGHAPFVVTNKPVSIGTANFGGKGISIDVASNVVGSMTIDYGGYIKLDVDNSFVGAPALRLGSINAASANHLNWLNLNGHNLTLSSLVSSNLSSSMWGTNYIYSASPATLTVSNGLGASSLYYGYLSGAVALTKSGAGTLILASNNNSYTGSTVVNGGVLQFNSTNAMGSWNSGANITNNGGALAFNFAGFQNAVTNRVGLITGGTLAQSAANAAESIDFGAPLFSNAFLGAVGTVTNAGFTPYGTTCQLGGGGGTLVITNAITSGSVTIGGGGGGKVVLTGTNTYSDGTLLSAGSTLNIFSDAALGIAGAGDGQTAGGLTFTNGGALEISGTWTNANRSISLQVGGGVFNVDSNQTFTTTNIIVGGGSLTKNGSGALILGGANTYGGNTTNTSGILQLGANNVLGTGFLVLNGGTLGVANGGNWIGTNAISLASASSAIDTTGGNLTWVGNIYGSNAQLSVSGNNVLTLAGTTSLSNLNLTGGAVLNTGALTAYSTNGNGIGTFNTSVLTNSGVINITALGGQGAKLHLYDNSRLDNTGIITNNSALLVGASSGAGTAVLNNYVGGVICLNSNSPTAAWATLGIGYNSTGIFNNVGGTLLMQASTLLVGGYNWSSTTGSNTLGILNINSGLVSFVQSGGAFQLGSSSNSASGTGIVNLNGGILATGNRIIKGSDPLSSGYFVFNGGTLSGMVNGVMLLGTDLTAVTVSNGAIVAVGAGATDYIAANLKDGGVGGGLTMLGPGKLLLSGSNTYSGGTLIAGGTLNVSNDYSLGATGNGIAGGLGNLTFSNGGVLQVSGTFTNNNRAVTLLTGGGAFNVDTFKTYAITNSITGAGGLTKLGAGTQVLYGVNSFAGGLTLGGGTLQVTNDAALGIAGAGDGQTAGSLTFTNGGALEISGTWTNANRAITLQTGGGAFNVDGGKTFTVTNQVTGAGGLTKMGIGNMVLAASNSYAGGTLIKQGLLQFNASAAIGGSSQNVTNNSVVAFNYAGIQNDLGRLSGASYGTLGLTASNLNDTINFNTTGLSNLFLGVASYGTTRTYNLNNFTPFVNTANNGSNAWKLGGGGTLVITNSIGGNDSVMIGGAQQGTNGYSTVVLAGNNSYTGSTVITNNQVLLVGTNLTALGNTAGVNLYGGTLQLSNSTVNVPINLYSGAAATSGVGQVNPVGGVVMSFGGTTNWVNGLVTFLGWGISIKSEGGPGKPGATYFTGGMLGTNQNISLYADAGANGSFVVTNNPINIGTGILSGHNLYLNVGSNNVAGGLNVDWGGFVQLGADNAFTNAPAGLSLGLTSAQNGADYLQWLDLNGHNFAVSSLLSTNKTLALIGTNYITSTSGPATLTVTNGAGASSLFNGYITGAVALVKSGAGTLILNAVNNEYTNTTTVNGGILQINPVGAMTNSAITVNNGTLLLGATNSIGNNSLIVNAGGSLGATSAISQAFLNWAATRTNTMVSGAIVLNANNTNSLNFGGQISNAFLGAAGGLFTNSAGAIWADATVRLGGGPGTLVYTPIIGSGTNLIIGPANGNAASVVTLLGSNFYNGGTLVQSGTLKVNSDYALGAPPVSFSTTNITLSGGNLAATVNSVMLNTNRGINLIGSGGLGADSGLTLYVPNAITGGVLNSVGPGKVVLSGVNSYTGGTVLAGGTLNVSNDATLGVASGGLTFTNGGALEISGTWTNANRAITLQTGGGAINVDNNQIYTVANSITGVGGLTKLGAGTQVLYGVNNFSGGLTLGGGTLQVTNDAALGIAGAGDGQTAGSLTFTNGGALEISGTWTNANRAITLQTGGGAIIVDSNQNFTITNTITEGGNLTKLGAGALTLAGVSISTSTNTGGVTLTAGTLNLNSALAAQGGILTLNGGINVFGAGLTNFTVGGLAGNMNLGLTNASGIAIALTISNRSGASYWGSLNDGGLGASLTKMGAGIQALYGVNNFSGGLTLGGGTLQVTNDAALGIAGAGDGQTAGSLTFTNGGALEISGTWTNANRAITLQTGGGAFNVDGGKTYTITNSIAGAGSLTKMGAGILLLNGVNIYSGGTSNGAGILQMGTDNVFGTGPVWLTGGTLASDSAAGRSFTNALVLGSIASFGYGNGTGPLTNNGNVSLAAGIHSLIISNTLVLAGPMSGSGRLVKQGLGTLVLSGANTYSGGTSNTAGILRMGADNVFGTGPVWLTGGTLASDSAAGRSFTNALSLSGNVQIGDITGSGSITNSGSVNIASYWPQLTVFSNSTLVLAGTMSGNSGILKMGGGTLVLSGSNTFSGGIQCSNNMGILRLGNDRGFGSGTLTLGSSILSSDGSASHTFNNVMNFLPNSSIQFGDAVGTGSLTNSGSVYLSGVNNLTVSNSMVALIGSVFGGGLIKQGPGTLVLGGSNTYSGGTFISNGVLQVGTGGTSGSLGSGGVINNGTLIFNRSDNFGISNSLAGTGTFVQQGVGILTLVETNGANTFSGSFLVNAGELAIGSDSTLGNITNQLTLNGGTLWLTAGSLVATRGITLGTNGGTFNGAYWAINGVISGSGALTKAGAGTLILSNTETFTGATFVQQGNLMLAGTNGALPMTSNITVGNGGTLTLFNSAAANNTNRLGGSIAFVSCGGGFNFTNDGSSTTYSDSLGSLTLNPGSLNLGTTPAVGGQTSTLTIGSLTRSAGGTLRIIGNQLGTSANTINLGAPPTLVNGILPGVVILHDGVVDLATHDGVAGHAITAFTSYQTGGESTWSSAATIGRPAASQTLTADRTLHSLVLDDGVGLNAPTSNHVIMLGGGGVAMVVQTGGSSQIAAGQGTQNVLGFGTNEGIFDTEGRLEIDSSNAANSLSGSGGITKTGPGVLQLGSAGANDFRQTTTGMLNLNQGVLDVYAASDAALASLSAIQFNGGNLSIHTSSNRYFNIPVVVTANTAITNYSLNGSAATLAFGSLTIGGQTLALAAQGQTAGSGGISFTTVSLTGNSVFIISTNGASGNTLSIGTINDGGQGFSFNKAGPGQLILTGQSTYLGPTAVNDGVLVLAGNNCLSTNNSVTVTNGATLVLAGSFQTIDALSGDGVVSNVSGVLTVGNANGDGTFNGTISGNGSLVKTGDGTETLGAQNNYNGGTTINGGTLEIGTANAMPTNDNVVLNGGALALAGQTQTVATLHNNGGNFSTGAGGVLQGTGATIEWSGGSVNTINTNGMVMDSHVVITSSGQNLIEGGGTLFVAAGGAGLVLSNSTLTINSDPATPGRLLLSNDLTAAQNSAIVSGGSEALPGQIDLSGDMRQFTVSSGGNLTVGASLTNGNLTKTGAGTLNMIGDNSSFTGQTVVSSGNLAVNGSLGGQITVMSNAVLSGSGTMNSASLQNGGILSPGNSPGTNYFNNLTLSGGSIVTDEVFQLNSNTVTADQTVVTNLTVNGIVTLRLTLTGPSGNYVPTNSLTLFSDIGGYTADSPYTNGWLSLDGAKLLNEGDTFTLMDTSGGTESFQISYAGGASGNDITLTVIPEPASVAMLAIFGLGIIAWRRFQRWRV